MKKQIIFLALSLVFITSTQAQYYVPSFDSHELLASVDLSAQQETQISYASPRLPETRQAHFPGGVEAMARFLAGNTEYPEIAREYAMEGIVKVRFTVLADGSLEGIRVIQSVNSILDASALKTIEKMPEWLPALQAGQAVKRSVIIPIEFKLMLQ